MDLHAIAASAEARVTTARDIADQLKGDDRLHRLSMQTVFVLEDVLFALREMADRNTGKPGIGPTL